MGSFNGLLYGMMLRDGYSKEYIEKVLCSEVSPERLNILGKPLTPEECFSKDDLEHTKRVNKNIENWKTKR